MNVSATSKLISLTARGLLAVLVALACGCQSHGPDLIAEGYLTLEVEAPSMFEVAVTAHEEDNRLRVHGTVSVHRWHEDAGLDVTLLDTEGTMISTHRVRLVHHHLGHRSRAPFSLTFAAVPPRGTSVRVRYRHP